MSPGLISPRRSTTGKKRKNTGRNLYSLTNMHLIKRGGYLELHHQYDESLLPRYKSIPEYEFKKQKGSAYWRWPCHPEHYSRIITEFPEVQVQDGLHQWMKNKVDSLAQLLKIKHLLDKDIDDYKFKTEPRPYQRVAFEFLRTGKKTLFLDPMGSGKTKTMLDYANWCYSKGYIDRCLIFVPKTIMWNWMNEIEKHSWETDAVVVDGTSSKRYKLISEPHKFYIMNWEVVRNKKILPLLIEMGSKRCCILGDECHRIKSHNSQVSKRFREIYSPYSVLATGTLISRVGFDVFSPLAFTSGLWRTWTSFANQYCVPGYWGGWEMNKLAAPQLREIVDQYSIKREKSFLMPWLPKKVYEKRYVELGAESQRAYQGMSEDFVMRIRDLEVISWNVLTQLLKLTEITTGFVRHDGETTWIGDEKLSAVQELVEEIVDESGQKVVIWAWYHPTIDELMRRYGGPPYNAVFIDGRVEDSEERMRRKTQFQTDPNVKIFIGQMASAGVGIDLFSLVEGMECSTAIRIEQNWSPLNMRQAEDRIHRMGQTSDSVTIIDIVARKKICEYILKVLEDKEQVERDIVPSIDREELLKFL